VRGRVLPDIIVIMNGTTKDKLIRFPPDVFTQLKEFAWRSRASENAYVVQAVREKIARDARKEEK
jgi:hypothetical protein